MPLILIRQTSAANFSFFYDSLNRLTNAAYSDGSSESYSYDNAGNRLSRSTSAATIQLDTAPPSVPANLTTNTFTPSQLSINWQSSHDFGYHLLNPDTYIDGSGLAGYYVFLNGTNIATTTDTNFLLSGLMPNTEYCLTVAAFDHNGNVSAQSTPLCLTTPVFIAPFLTTPGFVGGQFQISIGGGTPGPYDVLISSNLIDWQLWTNLTLPTTSNIFAPNDAFSHEFYQLRWSTNAP